MNINYMFGSDNHSGVHPEIMKAIEKVNKDYTIAYGNDDYTKTAKNKFKNFFGKNIDVYFVGNGTAANIIGLKTVMNSYNSVILADTSHMNVHECCGPEKFIGCKLETIQTKDGKLNIEMIKSKLVGFDDPHMAQPKVISITQPTELGTLYKPDEIKKIANFCHKNNLLLHMDGARLCNAAASLDTKLSAISGDCGVDILSFGGTKNGMMFGDAVVFFKKNLSKNFEYYRKQGMHLTSKMRYISVQFTSMLSNDLWYKNAKHANDIAKFLYEKIKDMPEINVRQRVEVNAVFASAEKKLIEKIQKKYFFHIFDEKKMIFRLMCSFNTTKKDIIEFVDYINKIK